MSPQDSETEKSWPDLVQHIDLMVFMVMIMDSGHVSKLFARPQTGWDALHTGAGSCHGLLLKPVLSNQSVRADLGLQHPAFGTPCDTSSLSQFKHNKQAQHDRMGLHLLASVEQHPLKQVRQSKQGSQGCIGPSPACQCREAQA